jgi:hypothetical protein
MLLKQRQKERQKGREGDEEDVSSNWKTLIHEKILEIERGSTRSHSVENLFWNSLWTCRKTDSLRLMMMKMIMINGLSV